MRKAQSKRDEVVQMYVSDRLGAVEIAKRAGIGSTSVYRILTAAGIKCDRTTRAHDRKGVPKFDQATTQEIAEAYVAGRGYTSLAAEYGCKLMAIQSALRRAGVQPRKRGNKIRDFTPEQVEEISQRWEAGESQHAIAQSFSTHQLVISRLLRFHGLTPETQHARGSSHGSWIGGRITNGQGYISVLIGPDDPMAAMRNTTGYVQEHRLVMARMLGRPLDFDETVHHINSVRDDNRPENLQIRRGRHGKGTAYCCADCGSMNIVSREID